MNAFGTWMDRSSRGENRKRSIGGRRIRSWQFLIFSLCFFALVEAAGSLLDLPAWGETSFPRSEEAFDRREPGASWRWEDRRVIVRHK
jgi:hypothetical protein